MTTGVLGVPSAEERGFSQFGCRGLSTGGPRSVHFPSFTLTYEGRVGLVGRGETTTRTTPGKWTGWDKDGIFPTLPQKRVIDPSRTST